MKKPHKFKATNGSDNVYGVVVYCEYCGLTVFDGSKGGEEKIEGYTKSVEGCPCGPVHSTKKKTKESC